MSTYIPPRHPVNAPFSEPITPAEFTPLQAPIQGDRKRLKPVHVALGSALGLFAFAAWYVLTARSVYIAVTPVATNIDLDGVFAVKVGPRYLVRSGEASLSLSAEGYYPFDGELTITDEQNQTYRYELLPLPGFLNLDTTPAEGIQVVIDGEPVGVTPLRDLELAAGEHTLTLQSARWQPITGTITMEGRQIAESLSYTLTPNWADVTITTTPPGAVITVDGEDIGATPMTAELLAGSRSVRVKLPAHKAWEQNIDVVALQAMTLPPITLEPADGLVTVASTPSGAGVTVDGTYQGQTPLEIEITPAERHNLTFFLNGYQTATRTLQVEAGEENSLAVTLQPVLTEVSIRVSPESTLIYVDGELKGSGSQTVSLVALPQQLEFRADGHVTQTREFTPRPGLNQTLSVDLMTLEEQRIASIEPEITTPTGQKMKLFYPTSFTMGASRREAGRQANEVLRDVVLDRPFYLSLTEVTNGQFRQFRADHSSRVADNTHTLDNNSQPVVNVAWTDAALFCNWLSERDGLPAFYTVEDGRITGFDAQSTGYRLPSEAEWAWAARVHSDAGELLKFPWGDQLPPPANQGNYADLSAANMLGRIINNYNDSYPASAPVASFPANQHGLYDMGGNVAEWVNDYYGTSGFSTAGNSNVNPLGPSAGNYHVIRGSSWSHASVTELRLSFRDYSDEARDDVGFRIARYLE